jgi:hypothetical protein
MKTYPTPKLIPIDMKKASGHEHLDLNAKDTYLCLIGKRYYTGKFEREWYGWNFDAVYDAGCQFDAPGSNSSDWRQIWKLIAPPVRARRIPEDKCKVDGCKGRLKSLRTRIGDPEGIRSDRQCRVCGQLYGCTKASLHKMSKEEYENEVEV